MCPHSRGSQLEEAFCPWESPCPQPICRYIHAHAYTHRNDRMMTKVSSHYKKHKIAEEIEEIDMSSRRKANVNFLTVIAELGHVMFKWMTV